MVLTEVGRPEPPFPAPSIPGCLSVTVVYNTKVKVDDGVLFRDFLYYYWIDLWVLDLFYTDLPILILCTVYFGIQSYVTLNVMWNIFILYLQQKIGRNVFFTFYPFQQCPDPTVGCMPYVSQHPPELSRVLHGRCSGCSRKDIWKEGVAITLTVSTKAVELVSLMFDHIAPIHSHLLNFINGLIRRQTESLKWAK